MGKPLEKRPYAARAYSHVSCGYVRPSVHTCTDGSSLFRWIVDDRLARNAWVDTLLSTCMHRRTMNVVGSSTSCSVVRDRIWTQDRGGAAQPKHTDVVRTRAKIASFSSYIQGGPLHSCKKSPIPYYLKSEGREEGRKECELSLIHI